MESFQHLKHLNIPTRQPTFTNTLILSESICGHYSLVPLTAHLSVAMIPQGGRALRVSRRHSWFLVQLQSTYVTGMEKTDRWIERENRHKKRLTTWVCLYTNSLLIFISWLTRRDASVPFAVSHLKRLSVLCSSIRLLLPVRSSSCSVEGRESGNRISVCSLQLTSTSYTHRKNVVHIQCKCYLRYL